MQPLRPPLPLPHNNPLLQYTAHRNELKTILYDTKQKRTQTTKTQNKNEYEYDLVNHFRQNELKTNNTPKQKQTQNKNSKPRRRRRMCASAPRATGQNQYDAQKHRGIRRPRSVAHSARCDVRWKGNLKCWLRFLRP